MLYLASLQPSRVTPQEGAHGRDMANYCSIHDLTIESINLQSPTPTYASSVTLRSWHLRHALICMQDMLRVSLYICDSWTLLSHERLDDKEFV